MLEIKRNNLLKVISESKTIAYTFFTVFFLVSQILITHLTTKDYLSNKAYLNDNGHDISFFSSISIPYLILSTGIFFMFVFSFYNKKYFKHFIVVSIIVNLLTLWFTDADKNSIIERQYAVARGSVYYNLDSYDIHRARFQKVRAFKNDNNDAVNELNKGYETLNSQIAFKYTQTSHRLDLLSVSLDEKYDIYDAVLRNNDPEVTQLYNRINRDDFISKNELQEFNKLLKNKGYSLSSELPLAKQNPVSNVNNYKYGIRFDDKLKLFDFVRSHSTPEINSAFLKMNDDHFVSTREYAFFKKLMKE